MVSYTGAAGSSDETGRRGFPDMATELDDALIDDLDVPIGWLSAEHAARLLVMGRYPFWATARIEYRMVVYVLALTIFLSETAEPAGQPARWPARRWAVLRGHTDGAQDWLRWCSYRLHQPVTGSAAAHRMAHSAWQWLCRRGLHHDDRPDDDGVDLRLGVYFARRALDPPAGE